MRTFARAFRDKGVGNLTLEAANAILSNEEVEAPKVFGLDAMGHTIKHTCGVFLSGIDHGSLENVVVDDVVDTGRRRCAAWCCDGEGRTGPGLEVSRMGKGSIGLKAVGDLANVSSGEDGLPHVRGPDCWKSGTKTLPAKGGTSPTKKINKQI